MGPPSARLPGAWLSPWPLTLSTSRYLAPHGGPELPVVGLDDLLCRFHRDRCTERGSGNWAILEKLGAEVKLEGAERISVSKNAHPQPSAGTSHVNDHNKPIQTSGGSSESLHQVSIP